MRGEKLETGFENRVRYTILLLLPGMLCIEANATARNASSHGVGPKTTHTKTGRRMGSGRRGELRGGARGAAQGRVEESGAGEGGSCLLGVEKQHCQCQASQQKAIEPVSCLGKLQVNAFEYEDDLGRPALLLGPERRRRRDRSSSKKSARGEVAEAFCVVFGHKRCVERCFHTNTRGLYSFSKPFYVLHANP